MSITVQEEQWSDDFPKEFSAITYQHWEEITAHKDIPLNVDWDMYKMMCHSGRVLVVTAREEDKTLLGYAIFLIGPHLHYKNHVYANQDVLFVRKDKRLSMAGVGIKLIRASEALLKARGVDVIVHHVKVDHDFSPLLRKLDYGLTEYIYHKRI